jgi:glycosyltransferase involved in cell wall biosynthesis
MISRKRPNFAIDVLDRLRALGNRVSLTMVGNGPQLGFVREEAARREPGVIEAPGYLDRFAGGSPTVFEYLAVSHILIHTSTDEGVPRGVIEAMSAGLPVVACAAGAMDEAVIDGVTGHVVGTSDIDKFVAATETLVCDPGKRRRFGDAGRKFCSERFSLDNMVDQTLEAYESLCGVRIHLSHSVHEVGAGVRGLGSAYTRDSNR